MDNNVAVLKIFPGITYNMMKPLLDNPNIKGVILETFGSGNAPTSSWFLNLIAEIIEKGIHVLNVSQCSGGSVAQGKYITSKYLEDLGVIGAGDMTFEAAITKMMFVLGNYTDNDVIKELLVNPMVGECS